MISRSRLGSLWFFAAALLFFMPARSHAQQVYTLLTDPAEVKVFTAVSEGLICQCGCHMVLSTCPHVDCPWAIPVRRFIEKKIKEGMPAESIIHGIVYGFGESIRSDSMVMEMGQAGRSDLVKGLVYGFGPGVSARTSPLATVLIVIGSIAAFILVFRWWRRRNAKRDKSPDIGKVPPKSDEDSILEKIKELDR